MIAVGDHDTKRQAFPHPHLHELGLTIGVNPKQIIRDLYPTESHILRGRADASPMWAIAPGVEDWPCRKSTHKIKAQRTICRKVM